jgi:uncharacterized protein
VDWHPWGREAFELARARNRPILLDIGAVWCHWCHVMDAESYDDADTAALINELFVPIKVDRDELPDVDARYQRAVQTLTGQGGWPLTAFLTPDGEVFYGGTYFPPQDRYGRPSLRRVLTEVARVWRHEPAKAQEAARGIRERLDGFARAEASAGEPTDALIDAAVEELARAFDFRYGGFGSAPKFPNAGAVDLMLDHWLDDGVDWARRIVVETLHAMARGGIHDQLGGGFHRYSVDARWIVPHFEKMAYDNGVLLETYARAAAAFEEPGFAAIVEGIVAWHERISPELLEAGGFPASQDADSGHDDDGAYWTWTRAELQAALPDAGLEAVALLRFGFDDPLGAMHLDPGRRVLFVARSHAAIARELGIAEDAVRARLAEAERRLRAARDQRPAPYVDETLYAGWVGLVAAGHAAAARYGGIARAAEHAARALRRAFSDGVTRSGTVLHRIGDADSGELLDDQAQLAHATLELYEYAQEPEWLDRARSLCDAMLARFGDDASGALRDRPADAEAAVPMLATPLLPVADAPSPAGNALGALVLLRLAAHTGEARYEAAAAGILRAFGGSAARHGSAAATYMKALSWLVRPVTTIVVVEEEPRGPLLDAALGTYRPRTVVRRAAPGEGAAGAPPELAAMVTGDAPRAYVCVGRSCAAPISEPAALRHALRTLRG